MKTERIEETIVGAKKNNIAIKILVAIVLAEVEASEEVPFIITLNIGLTARMINKPGIRILRM